MIQLELYLKELSNFLRTLTVKNAFLADHMLDTWVQDDFKSTLPIELHPYYRNITGDYILFDLSSLEEAYGIYKSRLTAAEYTEKYNTVIVPLAKEYGLKTTSTYNGRELPNTLIYKRCNVLPIISSYDTQEKIPFTKSLLSSGTHISTAEIYRIPNERYFRLLEKYPESSDIIKAIVYPIEPVTSGGKIVSAFDRAVAADNLELLAYNGDMLEAQEVDSLYNCVVETLRMINDRWAVKEFQFENLYAPAHQQLIWDILWLAIFVQRIANIRSGSTHSYHIWSYLKSNGLGEYRYTLTLRQQLFLYRNLRYLIEHKGTQHALEILIYVLLTSQNISLQGKNVKQTLGEGDESLETTARKSPGVQSITVAKSVLDAISNMKRSNPNLRFQEILEYLGVHAGEIVTNDQIENEQGYDETTETVYEKERSAGIEYQDDYLYDTSTSLTDEMIRTSRTSHMNTKLLELVNGATSDLYYGLYTKFFSETLMYRLSLGDLQFSITFRIPQSALQVILPAKDAVGVIFYILGKMNDYRPGDVYAHDDEMPGITGIPSLVKQNGKTVFEDYVLQDRPFTDYQVEWPYRTIYDGVPKDFPEVDRTFFWNQHGLLSSRYLNYVTLGYTVTIGSSTQEYTITDVTSDIADRRWISEDGARILQYYPNRSKWVITDRYETVLYATEAMSVFTPNIETLSWTDTMGNPTSVVIDPTGRKLVLDILMNNHHGPFHHVKTFARSVHEQAMDFLEFYLEDNKSDSAAQHALATTIRDARYANQVVHVDFFDGKTFTEYFQSDDEYVITLKNVMESYDQDPDKELAYGRLLEAIVGALMPIEEALISSTSTIMEDKYNKIIKLFKSMIAYNLAFISSKYSGVTSTVFRPFKSDAIISIVNHEDNDNDIYMEDCRTEIFERWKPAYPNQPREVVFKTILDDEENNALATELIVASVDKLREILSNDGKDEWKEESLVTVLVSGGLNADDALVVARYLMDDPSRMDRLAYAGKLMDKEDVIVKYVDPDVQSIPFITKEYLLGKPSTPEEIDDFNQAAHITL